MREEVDLSFHMHFLLEVKKGCIKGICFKRAWFGSIDLVDINATLERWCDGGYM